ncbi:mitochondrial carrier [Laetiporus sulphureus 93-53]|uniref:Mitochondrial carrier n=1 Tax=Laetiporus sulphureus 93-53 TaxID=1314785 RepID=A0A165E5W5_9APHY|nr:mitochondrial carrier [Laetiporus sulphureus 93-53]KZT06297.1 mitochondrial carrier [Laetiporus sulphureus 93-53]
MTSPPSSLRDLYAAPSNAWSFAPPLPPAASENTLSIGAQASSSSSPSYQWSTRTNGTNPLFDLSATFDEDESGVDVTVLLKGLAAAAFMQYATTALVMPWEVGKLLLQVQWVPRDTGEVPRGAVLTTDVIEEEGELSDDSNENDAYFADPAKLDSASSSLPPPRLADERGYVVRQSVLEEGTIPEYVIPVGTANGTWGMMKQLGRFRAEGWLSLWKGLLTSSINDALFAVLEPLCHSLLQAVLFPPPSDVLAAPSSSSSPLLLPVASHVLTGFILSPLDLIRTRLIIQSSLPRYRTYSGPIDALQQILAQEGGLRGVYLHPHLLIPALLDCTLRALIPLALPGIVASYLGFGTRLTPETHPLLWTVAELLGSCAGLLVTLPIETVRRRLQAQVRGNAKPIKACVELRPAPYNGVVDALWHIITEERSDLPVKRKGRARKAAHAKGKGKAAEGYEEEGVEGESWTRNTGIGQLYRGLGMRVAASFAVFVLAMVGGEEPDAGWAEL